MKRIFYSLLMALLLSTNVYAVTYGKAYTGNCRFSSSVAASPYTGNLNPEVGIAASPYTGNLSFSSTSRIINRSTGSGYSNRTATSTGSSSFTRIHQTSVSRQMNYGGTSSGIAYAQGGWGNKPGGGGDKPDDGGGHGPQPPQPDPDPDPEPTTKTCPMCGGTGYINDYGNGEVVTANWWRNAGEGDGTYCDGVATYHDPCDEETYGQTYHHDGKRTCPCCGGTGKVSSSTSSNWMSQNGWVQWTGESWSHLYHDEDGDGHCDEHYWHVPLGDGITFLVIASLLYLGIRILIQNQNRKHVISET